MTVMSDIKISEAMLIRLAILIKYLTITVNQHESDQRLCDTCRPTTIAYEPLSQMSRSEHHLCRLLNTYTRFVFAFLGSSPTFLFVLYLLTLA